MATSRTSLTSSTRTRTTEAWPFSSTTFLPCAVRYPITASRTTWSLTALVVRGILRRLPVGAPVTLTVCSVLCLSVSLSLCLSVSLSLCLSVSVSLCLSVSLSGAYPGCMANGKRRKSSTGTLASTWSPLSSKPRADQASTLKSSSNTFTVTRTTHQHPSVTLGQPFNSFEPSPRDTWRLFLATPHALSHGFLSSQQFTSRFVAWPQKHLAWLILSSRCDRHSSGHRATDVSRTQCRRSHLLLRRLLIVPPERKFR